jgi:hypothetical protein
VIVIPDDWMESEKGNTLLTGDNGKLVAWIRCGERCLEISYTPGNSPAFYIDECEYDPIRIGQHVVEELGGWYCVRWNLDEHPPVDRNGCIIGEDE